MVSCDITVIITQGANQYVTNSLMIKVLSLINTAPVITGKGEGDKEEKMLYSPEMLHQYHKKKLPMKILNQKYNALTLQMKY